MKDEAVMKRDFEILKEGFRLLEYDYLGGHGSRGYGKVKVKNLRLDVVIGEVSDEVADACQMMMDEVCK